MGRYLLRRLFLAIPTFFGITLISFVVINLAPGGPLEQTINAARFSEAHSGINQEILNELKSQYGFEKTVIERYVLWLKKSVTFDFGESFSYQQPVIEVIASKIPVSFTFALLSMFLTYLICVPLGIFKALKKDSGFDSVSGFFLYFSYATPQLILGILLITFFAGSSYLDWFPSGLLKSDNFDELTLLGQFWDRLHHLFLPLICYVVGGFTQTTLLMRNSMLDVISQDYIRTARAKGLEDRAIYFKHALRNALIPLIASFAGSFKAFFAGSVIVETIFRLDGMGLLGYQSILSRDYNVLMALIFITSLIILLGRLLSDILYTWLDPRIDFR